MPIAPRATARAFGSGPSSNPVTIPASVQVGDVMFLFGGANGATINFTTPSGWTLLEPAKTTTAAKYACWWRVAQAGDPGSSFQLATDGGAGLKTVAQLAVWSGTDATSPVMAFASVAETTSQTSHAASAVTTTAANAHVISAVMGRDTGGTSWTPPSGFTSRDSGFQGGSAQMSAAVADRAAATTGSYGSGNWVEDVSSANTCIYTLALAPLTTTTTVKPVSDVTTAGWSTTPAQGAGDSYASRLADGSDSTYASSPSNPSASVLEVKLAVPPGPLTQITHRGYAAGGGVSQSVKTELFMGSTLIASFGPETAIVTAPTTYTYALSAGQQAAQTSLTDLRVRITATVG